MVNVQTTLIINRFLDKNNSYRW